MIIERYRPMSVGYDVEQTIVFKLTSMSETERKQLLDLLGDNGYVFQTVKHNSKSTSTIFPIYDAEYDLLWFTVDSDPLAAFILGWGNHLPRNWRDCPITPSLRIKV